VITAHGNSLRALVKYLNGTIADLNIPTGSLWYTSLMMIDLIISLRHYYLGTSECHDVQVKQVSSVVNRR